MSNTWILIAELVGKFILLAVTIVSVLVLYALFGEEPFGFQLVTVIAYSWTVFLFVFFRWKGFDKAYSLRDKAVQRQIPRLLAIHGAFLLLVFAVLKLGSYLRSGLPSSWLAEDVRHHSWFSTGLIWVCTVVWLAQVYLSRSILSHRNRTKKQEAIE